MLRSTILRLNLEALGSETSSNMHPPRKPCFNSCSPGPATSFCHVILPRPRRNQRRIYRLKLKFRLICIRSKSCLRRLHPILVVALGKIWFVVRAARFVPQTRALSDDSRELQHVVELTDKRHGRVRPLRAIAQVDVLEAFQQLHQFGVGLEQVFVVAKDRAVFGHQLAQLAPEQKWILLAVRTHQAGIDFLLPLALGIEVAVAVGFLHPARILHGRGASDETSDDTRHQRVRTQTVGAVVLVFAFTRRENAGDVRRLFVIHPQAAHGVVHAGEDFHGHVARIVAHKLFVNFEDAFQLAIKHLAIDVSQVEIYHWLAVDPKIVLVDNLEDGASGHVARHQVAILRIPLLQKIPALTLRNTLRLAFVAGSLGNPDASPFAARRLRHETELVFSRNGGWMHLDELAVRVVAALLIERRLCRPSADHGVRRLPKDGANSTSRDDDRIRREGAYLHRTQVHRADATTDAVAVEHGGQKLPVLVLPDLAFGLVAPHLLIERVKKLLARGSAGKSRAVVQSPAEPAKVEQALRSAVECDAHTVEQVDDRGRSLAHGFYGRLVGEEISAVDSVVEVLPGGIAFALQVLGRVDTALRTHRVRTLHGHDGEQVNLAAHLGDFDDGCQACQAAAYHDNLRSRCHLYKFHWTE